MAEVLTIRIEHDLAERLAYRARRHGVSVEEEARLLLRQSLQRDWDRFWQEAEEIRHLLSGQRFEDSAELIRDDRER